jgi:hypothetical protein
MKIKLYQLVNSKLQYMSVVKIHGDYINLKRVESSNLAVVYTEKELKIAKEYYERRNIAVVAVDYVNACRRGKSKPKIIKNASLN